MLIAIFMRAPDGGPGKSERVTVENQRSAKFNTLAEKMGDVEIISKLRLIVRSKKIL